MKITIENTILALTGKEAEETMIKQISERGMELTGNTYIWQGAVIRNNNGAPVKSYWNYRAEVIFKEKQ